MYVREKDVIAVIDVRTDNSSASEFIKTLAAKGRVIFSIRKRPVLSY